MELAVKALVIGASGHLGNAVARELIRREYEVTAVGRRSQPPLNLRGLAVRYLAGDIDTPGQIDSWVADHDVVIDAAAPYPSLLAPSADSVAAVVEHASRRTQTLIDAVRRQHARCAYISSFATLPDHSTGPERARRQWIRGLHPYFAVKRQIEARLLAAVRDGLPAVIVNPTLCIGPWDLKNRELCFIPRILKGEAPITVSHALNVIDVRDVAAGLVAALEHEYYGTPILLSGHNISVAALYTWVSEMGGIRPPRFVAPIALGAIAAYCGEIALGMIGQTPSLPALAPMLTLLHDAFDPSPIQTELAMTLLPLSRTLTDAIEWYREIGYC